MAQTEENPLKSRIRERLEVTGKSMHAISKAIGANAGYVRDLLDPAKNTMPTIDKLRAIAQELDTSVDYLSGDSDAPDVVRSEVTLSDKHIDWRGPDRAEPGIPLVGTGDCADLEVCDASGDMIQIQRSSFDPDHHVRMLQRPPALRGQTDLYAIYFHGESMEPRFEAGEVGIVDPRRPVRTGDYVLVQLNGGDSDDVVSVLAKRLVRQNAQEIILEQFNPAVTFSVPKSKVTRVHRILQQTELLFG
tara:strand:- start:7942 stop:8682 length:741 start_codon:yes stop_codon:yes gene_type:complete